MNQRQQLISIAAALLLQANIVSLTAAFQTAVTKQSLTSHDVSVSKRILGIIPSNNSIDSRHNTFSTQLYVSADIDIDTIKADEARAKAIAQRNAQRSKTQTDQSPSKHQQSQRSMYQAPRSLRRGPSRHCQ